MFAPPHAGRPDHADVGFEPIGQLGEQSRPAEEGARHAVADADGPRGGAGLVLRPRCRSGRRRRRPRTPRPSPGASPRPGPRDARRRGGGSGPGSGAGARSAGRGGAADPRARGGLPPAPEDRRPALSDAASRADGPIRDGGASSTLGRRIACGMALGVRWSRARRPAPRMGRRSRRADPGMRRASSTRGPSDRMRWRSRVRWTIVTERGLGDEPPRPSVRPPRPDLETRHRAATFWVEEPS